LVSCKFSNGEELKFLEGEMNVMAEEVKGQKTWIDYDLPDLRRIFDADGADAPEHLDGGADEADALSILEKALGFVDEQERIFNSPIQEVKVMREFLSHIVEKRMDARERYSLFAMQTLQEPFEIWKIEYASSEERFFRFAYIGLFKGKRQMLVTVDVREHVILWNFMHQDAKSLNKHRHGELVYRR
jgi:hypothetical protein